MSLAENPMNTLWGFKKLHKEDGIVAEIRRRIVTGALRPGTKLPTRIELQQEFDSASQTVQRAMSRLINDGFLVPRGRLGTFVAEKPSHLHRYGVVFNIDPTDPALWDEAKFQIFLYREIVAMRSEHERDIVSYFKVDGHTDSEDYRRLLDDIHGQRLAGVFFYTPTYLTKPPLSALLDIPGMPFVTIGHETPHANLSAVSPKRYELVERALDYLHERKHQRVALLVAGDDELLIRFERGVIRRHMTTHPYWMQSILPVSAKSARNCMHLLMKPTDTPDALIISDDSLVEHATAGLLDSGVHIPQDLEVVAHCNFPTITRSMVPAKRIGFDVRQVLNTCLDVIDRRRRGESVSEVTELNPLFDDEVRRRPPKSENGNNENAASSSSEMYSEREAGFAS